MHKKKLLLSLIILFLFVTGVYGKYHPEIKWNEIKGDRFHVVFPQGYEDEAQYTLKRANELYAELKTLWGIDAKNKIKILLTDTYDISNGSATFFPFNRIEIYLFSPMPDTTLGGPGAWIDLALSHELTHIFVMNAGSGFTIFFRKLMGTNPVFFPMIYAPVWLSEGLCIYAESKLNPGGRLNTADYQIMLRDIARANKLPAMGHIYGEPTDWPGPTAKYFYGAAFIRYLADTYGEERVAALIKHYARCPIPLSTTGRSVPFRLTVSRRFENIFGKDLYSLWNEFRTADGVSYLKLCRKYREPFGRANGDRQHAASGGQEPFLRKKVPGLPKTFYKKYPVFGDSDRIFYFDLDYRKYPGIYEMDLKSEGKRCLIHKQRVNGMSYDAKRRKLYFSSTEYYRSFYIYSDIYEWDVKKQKVRRLTHGRRLFHPVSPGDGTNRLYCIKRERTNSYLALLDLKSGKETLLSQGFSAMAYPAVSPGGSRIAVSVKTKKGNWQIGLFSREGKLIRLLTPTNVKSFYPAWKNDRELLYITDQGIDKKDETLSTAGEYRLAHMDVGKSNGTVTVFSDPQFPSVQYFSLMPGTHGEQAIVSCFDAGGYKLGKVDLSNLNTQEIPLAAVEQPKNPPITETPVKIGKYGSLSDLLPKYFTPLYRSGGNDHQPGIYLSGTDILEKHRYEFESYYGIKTRTFNWGFNYIFDGLYPTFVLRYRDFNDLHRTADEVEYTLRRREANLICLYPLISQNKYQAWLYSGIYLDKTTDDLVRGGNEGSRGNSLELNGIKLGVLFSSEKDYYDSISVSDGFRLSLSYSRDLAFLGSDYEINTAAIEYKHYFSIFRPNVFAFRLAAADSWGEAKRGFYMGGSTPYPGYGLAGDDLFELMRGYPAGFFSGSGGYLLNLEYRVALFKIEKAFSLSRGLQRVYLNIFTDIGNMWSKKKEIDPSFSLGAELSLAILVGDFKYVLSGGIAVGVNPHHDPVVYFRIGNSF